VGRIVIDLNQFPRQPWMPKLMFELARRVKGTIDHHSGWTADGTPLPERLYRVRGEGVTDEEMARLWEEVQAEHRSSVRWGAGQRKKRRF
jgi:hypothetical protein